MTSSRFFGSILLMLSLSAAAARAEPNQPFFDAIGACAAGNTIGDITKALEDDHFLPLWNIDAAAERTWPAHQIMNGHNFNIKMTTISEMIAQTKADYTAKYVKVFVNLNWPGEVDVYPTNATPGNEISCKIYSDLSLPNILPALPTGTYKPIDYGNMAPIAPDYVSQGFFTSRVVVFSLNAKAMSTSFATQIPLQSFAMVRKLPKTSQ